MNINFRASEINLKKDLKQKGVKKITRNNMKISEKNTLQTRRWIVPLAGIWEGFPPSPAHFPLH